MPANAHDGAQLVGDRIHDFTAASGIDIDVEGGVRSVRLEKCGERNGDPVVHALAEGFALPLAHADDGIGTAIDANLLAQRIAGAEQIVDDIGADDGDVGTVRVFNFSERPAQFDIEV